MAGVAQNQLTDVGEGNCLTSLPFYSAVFMKKEKVSSIESWARK